jgi:hypothetical protein
LAIVHSVLYVGRTIDKAVVSVANWPKFRPQNTKVAPKKSQRPEETAVEFFADFSKTDRKVAELFCCVYFT